MNPSLMQRDEPRQTSEPKLTKRCSMSYIRTKHNAAANMLVCQGNDGSHMYVFTIENYRKTIEIYRKNSFS
jgi:hypothetical protein